MLHTLSATQLKKLLENGEVSALEVVEAHINRSQEVDKKVGGYALRFWEEALVQAKATDKKRKKDRTQNPLSGLPISVKENIDTAGNATTLGVASRRSVIPQNDAALVKMVREKGAIVMGKGNVPQALNSPMECENNVYGITRNPWRLSHGPGGSSGGEAALIASGQVPFGLGTDLGGSIRFPAAYCGIAGYKPTLGRWSMQGISPVLAGQEIIRSQVGPMARTVDDLILLMQALCPLEQHRFDAWVPPLPFLDPESFSLKGLRIGVYTDDGYFKPCATVARAVRESAKALESLGATLVPFEPRNQKEVLKTYVGAMSADGFDTLKGYLKDEKPVASMQAMWRAGHLPGWVKDVAGNALPLLGEDRYGLAVAATGLKTTPHYWALAREKNRLLAEELTHWKNENISALLCPVTATAAVPIGMSHDFTPTFVISARYNLFGFPAGTVPVTKVWQEETVSRQVTDRLDQRARQIEEKGLGLPVGVQVVGLPWADSLVLAVMKAVEAAAKTKKWFPVTPVDPKP